MYEGNEPNKFTPEELDEHMREELARQKLPAKSEIPTGEREVDDRVASEELKEPEEERE